MDGALDVMDYRQSEDSKSADSCTETFGYVFCRMGRTSYAAGDTSAGHGKAAGLATRRRHLVGIQIALSPRFPHFIVSEREHRNTFRRNVTLSHLF
jgi:hypothetical protein